MVSAEGAFFEEDVEFGLRPLLVVAEAVVGAVVGEDGAVGEDAWGLLGRKINCGERGDIERTVLDPAVGEG